MNVFALGFISHLILNLKYYKVASKNDSYFKKRTTLSVGLRQR